MSECLKMIGMSDRVMEARHGGDAADEEESEREDDDNDDEADEEDEPPEEPNNAELVTVRIKFGYME